MIRRYQRGSVRKKNGNYVLRYREDCFTPNGEVERPQKTVILGPVSAFRGKNEARKAADRIMQEVDKAVPSPQVSVTFGEFGRSTLSPTSSRR